MTTMLQSLFLKTVGQLFLYCSLFSVVKGGRDLNYFNVWMYKLFILVIIIVLQFHSVTLDNYIKDCCEYVYRASANV